MSDWTMRGPFNAGPFLEAAPWHECSAKRPVCLIVGVRGCDVGVPEATPVVLNAYSSQRVV
ncbi:hypothetical protein GCM10010423_47720 [Streptomyces levis]|uniref:Uncharacterized protein n=1 Tax=Streptomyces levis TaxID=285566 RepID=A0ABP6B720_9ACTN